MLRVVTPGSRSWSLARQLVVLQLCVVVSAVVIEAMVAVYRAPRTAAGFQDRQVLGLVTLTEVALLVGIAGSLFVADRVRKQTFDMEPAEIAKRYQHHDAMLHAVREGLIITGTGGEIVLANDEARRLLGLSGDCEGRRLRDEVAADWAATEAPVTDELQYWSGRVLMVSRKHAVVDGDLAGLVTTLRDRTELQAALSELEAERVLADELHKQAHEHANHLQRIGNLIGLAEYDRAARECTGVAAMPQQLSDQVLRLGADAGLASSLQVLHEKASGRGAGLRMDGRLDQVPHELCRAVSDVVTILVENAIDAVAGTSGSRRGGRGGRGGRIHLSLVRRDDGALHLTVRDNGPGITAEPASQVFAPRWTTKGDGHGFGLALASDIIRRLGGTITVRNEDGAVFDAVIPGPAGMEGPP